MPLDPSRVSTVTFDSYSTIVDVEGATAALEPYVSDPEVVATTWRRRSLQYAITSNFLDAYQSFTEMLADALDYTEARHDLALSPADRESVLGIYDSLPVFEDVRDGMERLEAAGYPLYIVSNGDPQMLAQLVEHAKIGDLISDTISADEVRRYKPAVDLYRHAASRTGTPVRQIAHATAGPLDVQGAMHAGMHGVWVDRKGRPWDPFDGRYDHRVTDLQELADLLDA